MSAARSLWAFLREVFSREPAEEAFWRVSVGTGAMYVPVGRTPEARARMLDIRKRVTREAMVTGPAHRRAGVLEVARVILASETAADYRERGWVVEA